MHGFFPTQLSLAISKHATKPLIQGFIVIFYFQSWGFPTISGITESEANTACTDVLVNSELGSACETLVDTSAIVIECVTGVLVRS